MTEYCNLIGLQDSCAVHKPMLTLSPDSLPLCRVGLGTRLLLALRVTLCYSNPMFSLRRGSGQALLRRTQVGPLQFHSSLDFDSWDGSGVLTLVFMYGKKWRPVRSLTATLTGKTAELVLLLLFPCLMDPWGCPWCSWFVPVLLRLDGNFITFII